MYGLNPPRGRERNVTDGSLQVDSVWPTIQGEGPFTGMPCVFIRLSGCNLRCWFCDTQWKEDAARYGVDRLVHDVLTLMPGNAKLVVITGGEPLRQNLSQFIYEMKRLNINVQIETAGSFFQPCLSWTNVTVVCSPKTRFVHPGIQAVCRDWKFILDVTGGIMPDGLPLEDTQRANGVNMVRGGLPFRPLPSPNNTIWVQPMDQNNEVLNEQNHQLCVAMAMKYGYRVSVQTHKILDVD